MVRRRGHPLRGFPFCTGGDVLAGRLALQGEQRSHGAGQSRRGTPQDVPVQRLGEQSDSVAVLGK